MKIVGLANGHKTQVLKVTRDTTSKAKDKKLLMCASIHLARISREWNTSIIHKHWFIEFWLITQVCAFVQASFRSVYYDTYKLSYHLQMAKMMKIPYVKFVGQTLMFFVFLAVVMAMSTTEEPHQGSVMTYHNVRYVCWHHLSHHITSLLTLYDQGWTQCSSFQ